MLESEINELYNQIAESYLNNNLAEKGVVLPNLKKGSTYTKDALTLVYLFKKINQGVSKGELTGFINEYYPGTNDVQQARHLAAQKGWYILSGTRGDANSGLKSGEYKLVSVEIPYLEFTNGRRKSVLGTDSWEGLKEKYNYRCATCGSKEGEEHYYNPSLVTKLQKGHKNPNLPMDISNIIPQCSWCNRAYRNYFCFDETGRVSAVNDPNFILKSNKEVQKKMIELLNSLNNEK
jgi:uncharacterized protein CbrC (UPF0167 family)